MEKSVMQQVYDLLANEDVLVEFANSMGDEAIPKGDIRVAQKAAALAAVKGIAFVASYDHELDKVDEAKFIRQIELCAKPKNDANATWFPTYIAHLTWLSGKFYQGEEKIAALSNYNFEALDESDIEKDVVHIQVAAKFLLGKLTRRESVAAA